jgi:hypothetical protein
MNIISLENLKTTKNLNINNTFNYNLLQTCSNISEIII